MPFDVSRHFASSMTGLNVRLKRPIRFMRPAMGQKRVHHLRRNTSSPSFETIISTNWLLQSPSAHAVLKMRFWSARTVAPFLAVRFLAMLRAMPLGTIGASLRFITPKPWILSLSARWFCSSSMVKSSFCLCRSGST